MELVEIVVNQMDAQVSATIQLADRFPSLALN